MATHEHIGGHGGVRVGKPSQDTLSKLARPGLVAHGVLYITIGILALQIARDEGQQQQADGAGAIRSLAEQPLGKVLLLLMAIGLAALALWRAAQAIWGDPVSGSEAKDRAMYTGKVVLYAGLAASSVGVLLGNGGGSGSDQQAESWTARAMGLPGGRLLVGAIGLGVIAYGIQTLWQRAINADFMEQLDRAEMGHDTARTVQRVGQLGYAARSVVFALIGGFLVVAAVTFDPQDAKGLSQSLQDLAGSEWSPLLWAVAAGLVAFGLLSLAFARYRRIR